MAYADAFGEAGIGGTLSYYLASAFDKVSRETAPMPSVERLPSLRDY